MKDHLIYQLHVTRIDNRNQQTRRRNILQQTTIEHRTYSQYFQQLSQISLSFRKSCFFLSQISSLSFRKSRFRNLGALAISLSQLRSHNPLTHSLFYDGWAHEEEEKYSQISTEEAMSDLQPGD
jgi:hypothetical protein